MDMDLIGYASGYSATLRWPFVRREAAAAWLMARLGWAASGCVRRELPNRPL